jgi:hypothetical protein
VRRNLADEAAGYLKGVAQARHWPASACWKCRRKHPGPHDCPAPPWHRLRVAAVLACYVTAGVLVWFVPGLARFVNVEAWPLGIITGAVLGWRARGKSER